MAAREILRCFIGVLSIVVYRFNFLVMLSGGPEKKKLIIDNEMIQVKCCCCNNDIQKRVDLRQHQQTR